MTDALTDFVGLVTTKVWERKQCRVEWTITPSMLNCMVVHEDYSSPTLAPIWASAVESIPLSGIGDANATLMAQELVSALEQEIRIQDAQRKGPSPE